MSDESPLKAAQEGVSILGEIIKAAGDNPNAKAAASNLGQTAVTLTKTINNALLPLAAINFAFERARVYFSGKFQQELLDRAAQIPEEMIVDPKPSIAGPVMQSLAFTHDEPDLKEMYLSLLGTSMDSRVCDQAHPAFIEIIRQLEAVEARVIRDIMLSPHPIPIAQVQVTSGPRNYYSTHEPSHYDFSVTYALHEDFLSAENRKSITKLPGLTDNLLRLGLIQITYDELITNLINYDWVLDHPEVSRLQKQQSKAGNRITRKKGILLPTKLGSRFATAVGLSGTVQHKRREA